MSVNLQEFDSVLGKISELKVFFDFGQKSVPVLEDVSTFVREIGPAVESLKAMIEVTSARIPKASEQLGRVNQTSEQASTDILNTIDTMMAQIDGLLKPGQPAGLPEDVAKTAEQLTRIVGVLVQKSGWDEDIRELFGLWNLHEESLKSYKPESVPSKQLESLKNDCTNIMMALQVQDITGQQIAMVIGIMQAIGDVLNELSAHFSDVASARAIEPTEIEAPAPESIGSDDTKRLVESLLMKARAGELVK